MVARRFWWVYPLIGTVVSSLGVSIILVVYVNQVDADSNRRWCGIVTTLDDAYKSTPPASEVGRKIARQMHQLRTDFGC